MRFDWEKDLFKGPAQVSPAYRQKIDKMVQRFMSPSQKQSGFWVRFFSPFSLKWVVPVAAVLIVVAGWRLDQGMQLDLPGVMQAPPQRPRIFAESQGLNSQSFQTIAPRKGARVSEIGMIQALPVLMHWKELQSWKPTQNMKAFDANLESRDLRMNLMKWAQLSEAEKEEMRVQFKTKWEPLSKGEKLQLKTRFQNWQSQQPSQ